MINMHGMYSERRYKRAKNQVMSVLEETSEPLSILEIYAKAVVCFEKNLKGEHLVKEVVRDLEDEGSLVSYSGYFEKFRLSEDA